MQRQKDERLPLHDVAAAMVQDFGTPGESGRSTKDKLVKKLKYAVSKGYLRTHGKTADNHTPLISMMESVGYLRRSSARVNGRPAAQGMAVTSAALAADDFTVDVKPPDLRTCLRHLQAAERRILELSAALRDADLEIARLKPLAEAYERFRRSSGRRGRP